MAKQPDEVPGRGFTIVELLIVIVVIAVLASISFISYGSFKAKAENTKTIAAVSQARIAMELLRTETGSYLVAASSSTADRFPCLGEYVNDTCASITGTIAGGVGAAYVSNSVNTQLRSLATIPQPSTNAVYLEGSPVVGAFLVLPTPDDPNAGNTYSIGWVLQDTASCGINDAEVSYQDTSGIFCYLNIAVS